MTKNSKIPSCILYFLMNVMISCFIFPDEFNRYKTKEKENEMDAAPPKNEKWFWRFPDHERIHPE